MYKVLIVGLGGQGLEADLPKSNNDHKVISYTKAFSVHEGFEIVGACDPDEEKRKKAEKYYNIDTYRTLKDFKGEFDIAIVATPDNYHYSILMQLAERKPKLVICEKPLCEDLKQAKMIVNIYKLKNIPLMVDYTRRFIPEIQELKQKYEAGKFGKLLVAYATFNRGWLHTGTHAIDFFNFILGDDAKPVYHYIDNNDFRIWQLDLYFEKKCHWQEKRVGNMPVPEYYDNHMWYVAENAYNFLEWKEPLLCTGDDALKALEICYKLMR